MLYRAEAIPGIRMQSLINEQFDFLDHHKMKQDFLFYFKEMYKNKDEKRDIVCKHFHNFVQGIALSEASLWSSVKTLESTYSMPIS